MPQPHRCPFHQRGLKCKSRKPRDTWSNRHDWPWSTKWSRAEANGVLSREHAGHSKHPFPTIQETTLYMDTTRWSYRIQIDYILGSWRWRSSIQSAKTRQWAEYGWDHELLIVKLRPNLKKVGKTTRSFRYDLNQTPYDYTVEMTNRFKILDSLDRMHEELWTEVCNIV